MSTPRAMVNSGTITTPPPRPVMAPRKPAKKDPAATTAVNSRIDMVKLAEYASRPLEYSHGQEGLNRGSAIVFWINGRDGNDDSGAACWGSRREAHRLLHARDVLLAAGLAGGTHERVFQQARAAGATARGIQRTGHLPGVAGGAAYAADGGGVRLPVAGTHVGRAHAHQ